MTTTATMTKTQRVGIAPQVVAAGGVVNGDSITTGVATGFGGTVSYVFGRQSASASTASAFIRLQSKIGGQWYNVSEIGTNIAAVEAEAITAHTAGTAVLSVASTANIVAGSRIFVLHGTAANSVIADVKSIVANTSVTLTDVVANSLNGLTLYTGAENGGAIAFGPGHVELRVQFDASQFTQSCFIRADVITLDSQVS